MKAYTLFLVVGLALGGCASDTGPGPSTIVEPEVIRAGGSAGDAGTRDSVTPGTTQPEAPEAPSAPEMPDTPDTPEIPEMPDAPGTPQPSMTYTPSGASPIQRWLRMMNTFEEFGCQCEATTSDPTCEPAYEGDFACHFKWATRGTPELGAAMDCEANAAAAFMTCLSAEEACTDEPRGDVETPCGAAFDAAFGQCDSFEFPGTELYDDFETFEWCLGV